MPVCYFCGMEYEKLKECAHCRQLYCDSHSETINHDCPLIVVQNPYEIDTQSSNEASFKMEEILESDGSSEGNDENESEGNAASQFDVETHKSIIENIIAEKAKNPKSISQINQEFTKEAELNEPNAKTPDSDDKKEDIEDEGTDIDMDIPGVYDVEAEFKEPDGFIRPIQIIKHDSPYVKKVKTVENKKLVCYFCGIDLSDQKNAKFIRVRNVEESFFKGLGRELKFKFFGSNKTNDGFYLCEKPDCVTKWKMKEPVYIKFGSGNIQKYVNEN